MIKLTENINEANAITHAGTFHTDEVLTTVILSKIFDEIIVYRTTEVPENINPNVLVYDIGFGKFDHHQKGGNGKRENGVPYASCGLIWKEFGHILTEKYENSELVWKIIDKKLIQPVDANDNGTLPRLDYPIQDFSFSNIISSFNPTWDSNKNQNEAFMEAINFAESVFAKAIENATSQANAYSIVENSIETSKNQIMILEKAVPWKETIFDSENPKASELLFVVYPSNRGGYNWQCVPDAPGSFGQRKSVPEEWRGLRDENLQKVSGIKSARFCHATGFMGSAETFEDALKMAEIAVSI